MSAPPTKDKIIEVMLATSRTQSKSIEERLEEALVVLERREREARALVELREAMQQFLRDIR